jgi:hypothetical protein
MRALPWLKESIRKNNIFIGVEGSGTEEAKLLDASPLAIPVSSTASHLETVSRSLQTANYRANYVGRFQYLLDGFYRGPYPVLQAYSKGSIEVLATSDPTISCEPLPAGTEPGFQQGVQCTNSCADIAACSNIWQESGNVNGGAFGEIFFQCEGDIPTDTDGAFTYEDIGDGSCTSGNLLGDGRNFHLAQMGNQDWRRPLGWRTCDCHPQSSTHGNVCSIYNLRNNHG